MGPGADKLRRFRSARAGGKLRAAVEKVNGTATNADAGGENVERKLRKTKPL
jgi:hypothetical protein